MNDMLYIIQNDPEVPAGILGEQLTESGTEFETIHPYLNQELPPLKDVTAAIILGGSMSANDEEKHPFITGLKDFIRAALKNDTPLLGICLGGQLLAAASAGEVTSNQFGEKGTYSIMLTDDGESDPLFSGIGSSFISFQWHDDSFSIPPNGRHLAFTSSCHNQAFRIGSSAWGLQFHPEVDHETIQNWSSWTEETARQTEQFVNTWKDWEEEYREASRRLLHNFLRIARR